MKKNYLLPYLLLLSFMVFNACSKDEPESPEPTLHLNVADSLAIIDIFNDLDGPNWWQGKSWDLKDWKTWGGVQFFTDENMEMYVSEIGFHTGKGRISESIGKLSHLKILRLYAKEAEGSLPKSIGCLTNLEELHVCNSKLSGELPKELGNLKKIQSILIESNRFSGMIPVELANLPEDIYLSLSDNEFSGSVPLEILKNREVVLSGNNLTELPLDVWLKPEYRVPHIIGNRLSGEIPEEVFSADKWWSYKERVGWQQEGYGYSNYDFKW